MQNLGLSETELESIVMSFLDSMVARAKPGDVADLAGIVQHGLRNTARAISENNQRIAEQLKKAGINIT